VTIIRLGLKSL